MKSYFDAMKKYYKFEGRATRKQYWIYVLTVVILMLISLVLDNNLLDMDFPIVTLVVGAIHLLPWIMLTIRRLHDLDLSGWYIVVYFIPSLLLTTRGFDYFNNIPVWYIVKYLIFYGCSAWVIAISCTFGTNGLNKYGDAIVEKENYQEMGLVNKLFKYSVAMHVVNNFYMIGFFYINFNTIYNSIFVYKVEKSSEFYDLFLATKEYIVSNSILMILIAVLFSIFLYKLTKNKQSNNLTKINFYAINNVVTALFIVSTVLLFANIPYYQKEIQPAYKFRTTTFNPKTSNYLQYKESCNNFLKEYGKIKIKYKLDEFFDPEKSKDREVKFTETIVDRAVQEASLQFEKYVTSMKDKETVCPNSYDTNSVSGLEMLSYYNLVMYDIEQSMQDGELNEYEIRRYNSLWDGIIIDIKHKNPQLTTIIINISRINKLMKPFYGFADKDNNKNNLLREEIAVVLKEKIHFVRENMIYNFRDSLLTELMMKSDLDEVTEIFPFKYNSKNIRNNSMIHSEFLTLKGVEEFDENYIKKANRAKEILENNIERVNNKNSIARYIINPMGDMMIISMGNGWIFDGYIVNERRTNDELIAVDYLLNKELYQEAPKRLQNQNPMKYVEEGMFKKVVYTSSKNKSNEEIFVGMKKAYKK